MSTGTTLTIRLPTGLAGRTSDVAPAYYAGLMGDLRESRVQLFSHLEDPATAPQFFECVADDVDWTVMGTHPVAGRYRDKVTFQNATFGRLGPLMQDGVRLALQHVYVDGETTIAELKARSVTLEGAPYDMEYCWVCRFDGDVIVEVRSYLDSAMVADTVARNEGPRRRRRASAPVRPTD